MMKPEIAVLDLQGQYRIHTEFYRSDTAQNTIILVNGSMATTASFAQTVKNLHPHLNVVLYDQPYAGQSKPHNQHQKFLTKELEAQVLLELVAHFDAQYVLSFSWGGTAALTALAGSPQRIKKAVISSFSPLINPPMRNYLERGRRCLADRNRPQVGNLVNDTLGKHLPSLFKRFNYRHVSTLAEHEYAQMHFHIDQVLTGDPECYLKATQRIDIPVLSSMASGTNTPQPATHGNSPARSATANLFVWKTPGTFWTWNTNRPATSARLPCSTS